MKIAVLTTVTLSFLILTSPSSESASENFEVFRSSELECIIGNNAESGEHRSGYNGIWSLTSVHQEESLFVPAYSGLNLEHIFDSGPIGEKREEIFEPRYAPMTFRRVNEHTALLHQPPTPLSQIESSVEFKLVDPYYIEGTARFQAHSRKLAQEGFGIFWASYINGPLDKSIYFLKSGSSLESPVWQQFSTQYHGHDSTVVHEKDRLGWNFSSQNGEGMLFDKISPIRFSAPFYYGRFKNMVYILMFKTPEGVRFSHSPSGGGPNASGDDTCPAWDFQFLVPEYQVKETYEFQFRLVYKPWSGRDDVLNEVRRYRN